MHIICLVLLLFSAQGFCQDPFDGARESSFGARAREAMGSDHAEYLRESRARSRGRGYTPTPKPERTLSPWEEDERTRNTSTRQGAFNLGGFGTIELHDAYGKTLVTLSSHGYDGDIFFTFGEGDTRVLKFIETGYFLNGTTQGLTRDLARYKEDGTNPLNNVYERTKQFLDLVRRQDNKKPVEDHSGFRRVSITAKTHPELAEAIETLRKTVPKKWHSEYMENFPDGIVRATLEYREATFEQVDPLAISMWRLGKPVIEYQRTLVKTFAHLLSSSQLQNYEQKPQEFQNRPGADETKLQTRFGKEGRELYFKESFNTWVVTGKESAYWARAGW